MESNITDQQYLAADLQLSEPHFDEEATVLSARPVVPLHEVRTGARSSRRLGFGLAILVALLVGAFGATLIYQQRGQKEEEAIAEPASSISEPAVQEGPVAGASGSAVDLNGSAPSFAVNTDAGTTRPPLYAPAQENKREMRRAERIEARREREAERQTNRDARGHKNQPSDDLLRIREIFEGSRRP